MIPPNPRGPFYAQKHSMSLKNSRMCLPSRTLAYNSFEVVAPQWQRVWITKPALCRRGINHTDDSHIVTPAFCQSADASSKLLTNMRCDNTEPKLRRSISGQYCVSKWAVQSCGQERLQEQEQVE